jgi:hypothetical protein
MEILAFAPLPLQSWLLWLLVRGGAYKSFPFFFSYTVYSVLATTIRFVVRNDYPSYYAVYWASEAVYALLGFIVLYEVFRAVFRNLGQTLWFRLLFPLALLCTIILTAARTGQIPQPIPDQMPAWIVTAELAVRLFQVAMFVLLAMLVPLVGLRWRQYAFGICAGFGFYATVALLTTTQYSDAAEAISLFWGVSLVAAYSIAVLIWLWFFRVQQKAEPQRSETPPLVWEDLQLYKHLIQRIRRP